LNIASVVWARRGPSERYSVVSEIPFSYFEETPPFVSDYSLRLLPGIFFPFAASFSYSNPNVRAIELWCSYFFALNCRKNGT